MEYGILLQKLHDIQETYGYISEVEIDSLAEEYSLPRAKIYGVIKFYSMLYTEPVGKYIIRICDSLSCHINNSGSILVAVEEYLGIEPGETTGDGKYTLEVVECLGYCGEGPVMMVNDDVYTHVNPGKALKILKESL